MATVPTQVRIDENLKKQATELFSQLGMDMSSAMNIFLRQCVMRGGLPFDVVVPQYSQRLLRLWKKRKELARILKQRDTVAFLMPWRTLMDAV